MIVITRMWSKSELCENIPTTKTNALKKTKTVNGKINIGIHRNTLKGLALAALKNETDSLSKNYHKNWDRYIMVPPKISAIILNYIGIDATTSQK